MALQAAVIYYVQRTVLSGHQGARHIYERHIGD